MELSSNDQASSQVLHYYWEALATTLDKQPKAWTTAADLGLDDFFVPKSQQCQLVITRLINEFVEVASFSIRAPQKQSRSQMVTGKISFDSFPDGPLLLKALTAVVRLQLLPNSASSEATASDQDVNRVPLLVAAASIVLDEAERLGSRLTCLGLMEMLRSLSLFGYGGSVLAMLSWKDPFYTGVSIARKYRTLSVITDEIADLIELVDSITILKGVSIALEALVENPNRLRAVGSSQVPVEEGNLGRHEIDVLQHISEVLKIPSDFTKAITGIGASSRVTEFLTRAQSLLRITATVVEERSWIHKLDPETNMVVNELVLCCAALAAAEGDADVPLSWTTREVRCLAADVVYCISEAFHGKKTDESQNEATSSNFGQRRQPTKRCENLMLELLPIMLPNLKNRMECDFGVDSKAGFNKASDHISEDSAAVAAHQMFWCLKQVTHPQLGPLCPALMPCVLTALDHYSPDVKRQAMKTLIHMANNLNPTELRWYKDVILDGVTRSLVGCGELWPVVVETAVTLATCMEGRNPRGKWYRRILDEMLGELERQQYNSKHCVVWLQHIGKQFEYMGLVLVAHFKRLLPLLFSWLHAMNDSVCLLILQNLLIIIKHTWPRVPYFSERLWEELVLAYQKSWDRRLGSAIRAAVVEVSLLLKLCGGPSFEIAWHKSQTDSTLEPLISSLAHTADPVGS